VTAGRGNFVTPAWGPDGHIAYVSKYGDKDCLSLADANGHHAHDLFCAPSPAELARPAWSPDGTTLYVAAGHYVGSADPFWHALAYRVDARTGAAAVLDDRVFDDPQRLEIAPDGRHGVYSDPFTSRDLTLVDFASGAARQIGTGHAPRWSRDGRRIAFTGEVFEDPPDFRYYEPLYVMDADGSHVRRLTLARVPDHAYTAIDWSSDGRRLLVDRRIFLDPSLTITSHALRFIDVATGGVIPLTGGQAEPGAWFQR